MMTADINDTTDILWKKIAYNLYEMAFAAGALGLNPPSWNDNISTLQKKIAYYTAILVDTQ